MKDERFGADVAFLGALVASGGGAFPSSAVRPRKQCFYCKGKIEAGDGYRQVVGAGFIHGKCLAACEANEEGQGTDAEPRQADAAGGRG